MKNPTPRRRTVTIRASRDTLVLVASAVAVTLALSYSLQRQASAPSPAPVAQGWVGRLAEVTPDAAPPVAPEPMSSDSMVVPKSTMALPQASPAVAARPPAKGGGPALAARPKTAGAADKPAAEASPVALPAKAPAAQPTAHRKQGFAFSDLDPLPHLPDAMRRPFSYAGTKIAGWFDRL